jgi:hypothetical protein
VRPRHLLRLGSLRSIHYDPSTGSINGEKLSRKILTWLHQLRGATGLVVIPWLYDSRQKTFWVLGCVGLRSWDARQDRARNEVVPLELDVKIFYYF